MGDVVGLLVPLLPAPATVPYSFVVAWASARFVLSFGIIYSFHSSLENLPNVARVDRHYYRQP